MSLKDFQIMGQLGQGAFSTVYRVRRLIDNQEYAMKKVKLDNLSDKEKDNGLHEVRVLASIVHPNIIAYKQAFIEKGSSFLFIIMEFADDGDLLDKIKMHAKNKTMFEEKDIWSIFIQVTQGLKVLHDMKILHRDIKSANIFLMKNGVAKLGDLNVSKIVKSLCQTQTGTPYYASPEIWKDEAYDKKSDMWSLGCVLYEMCTLKPPFRSADMQGLYKKVIRGFYSRLPPEYTPDLTITLKMLLQVAPHLRATSDKILENPIVQKYLGCLPEGLARSDGRKVELMRTIVINRDQSVKELAKNIELPKPRYFSTLEVVRNAAKSTQEKNYRFLPRIKQKQNTDIESQKTLQPPMPTPKNQQSPGNMKQFQSIISMGNRMSQSIDRKQVEQNIMKRIESYHHQGNKDYCSLKTNKKYEGRIKNISPDIIEKILRKERQKAKVYSIIGS